MRLLDQVLVFCFVSDALRELEHIICGMHHKQNHCSLPLAVRTMLFIFLDLHLILSISMADSQPQFTEGAKTLEIKSKDTRFPYPSVVKLSIHAYDKSTSSHSLAG